MLVPLLQHADDILLWPVFALALMFAVATALKGRWVLLFVGVLVSLVWPITAFRLARPSSWWARRFYDDVKMTRAVVRHGGDLPAARLSSK
jgi:hypothetical protein